VELGVQIPYDLRVNAGRLHDLGQRATLLEQRKEKRLALSGRRSERARVALLVRRGRRVAERQGGTVQHEAGARADAPSIAADDLVPPAAKAGAYGFAVRQLVGTEDLGASSPLSYPIGD
jgi:hypothetical protein